MKTLESGIMKLSGVKKFLLNYDFLIYLPFLGSLGREHIMYILEE